MTGSQNYNVISGFHQNAYLLLLMLMLMLMLVLMLVIETGQRSGTLNVQPPTPNVQFRNAYYSAKGSAHGYSA